MTTSLIELERLLGSPRKEVRLKALKLILRHPDASPLQIAQGLCSDDNRNFEFQDEFDLGPAMRASWTKLRGVDDDEVYSFLELLYRDDPDGNRQHVVHVLELIGTPRTATLLSKIRDTTPDGKRYCVDKALSALSYRPSDSS
jgi:hypothetical protein